MLHFERRADAFVVHELHADAAGEPLTDQQLWDALTGTFQSQRYQPPMLPPAAREVLAWSSCDGINAEHLVRLLEKDPGLAKSVLSLCNSPLYGASGPSPSLSDAGGRAGVALLRDAVVEAAHARVFRNGGYSEAVDRVRLHSRAVAHLSRAIARFVSFEADHAFLCGLLHDVGLSAALVALGDAVLGQKLRSVVDLWPALAALHETVGGSVATVWRLPPDVAMVIRLHHALKVGDVVHPVAAIVVLAESIAAEHGFGLVPPPRNFGGPPLLFGRHRIDEPSFSQALLAKAALGLDDREPELAAVCDEVIAQLKVAQG